MGSDNAQCSECKPCAICETNEYAHLHISVYSKHTETHEAVIKCANCGLVYVNEPIKENRPFVIHDSAEALESSWKKQFPDEIDVYEKGSWGTDNQDIDDVFEWQYDEVIRFMGNQLNLPGYTVAEIGCARGYLLSRIQANYPSLKVIGIEPSPVMAELAREITGTTIINSVIENAGFEEKSIDAVIGFGSFIQVRDPLSTLRTINTTLRPGGKLLLDSPNDNSLTRKIIFSLRDNGAFLRKLGLFDIYERSCRKVYNPDRFYYYTAETFKRIFEKTGFEIVDIRMRQARYLTYKNAGTSWLLSIFLRIVSLSERLVNRQNWVQVSAIKVRDA